MEKNVFNVKIGRFLKTSEIAISNLLKFDDFDKIWKKFGDFDKI